MTTLLRHDFATELEVRSEGDGRTVFGIAVPFNEPVDIRDWFDEYTEVFAEGSFAKTIAERGDKVKFLWQHDRGAPIGRATTLREDTEGLYAEFRVSKTQQGDEVLELVRDGALDSFSIGFMPVQDLTVAKDGKVTVTRTEVSLREVSAVTFPAYESALMSGVRELSGGDLVQAQAAFETLRAGKPLSAENTAVLKHVLSLVASADKAVDEAQPLLATLLGVPNPDEDEAGENESADTGRTETTAPSVPSQGMSYELATRRARMLGVRI
jgi:HK97 family phage prohead protease